MKKTSVNIVIAMTVAFGYWSLLKAEVVSIDNQPVSSVTSDTVQSYQSSLLIKAVLSGIFNGSKTQAKTKDEFSNEATARNLDNTVVPDSTSGLTYEQVTECVKLMVANGFQVIPTSRRADKIQKNQTIYNQSNFSDPRDPSIYKFFKLLATRQYRATDVMAHPYEIGYGLGWGWWQGIIIRLDDLCYYEDMIPEDSDAFDKFSNGINGGTVGFMWNKYEASTFYPMQSKK